MQKALFNVLHERVNIVSLGLCTKITFFTDTAGEGEGPVSIHPPQPPSYVFFLSLYMRLHRLTCSKRLILPQMFFQWSLDESLVHLIQTLKTLAWMQEISLPKH